MKSFRRWQLCVWVCVFGLIMGGVDSQAASARTTNKLIIYPSEQDSIAELRNQGVGRVRDHGSYWIVEATDEQVARLRTALGERAVPANYLNRIELSAAAIDTASGELPNIPANLREGVAVGRRLRLIQFVGPVQPAWLDRVRAAGKVKIVSYIPNNAYVVMVDQAAEDKLQALTGEDGPIQWIGAYHPYYKVRGNLLKADANQQAGLVDVRVGIVDDEDAQATLQAVRLFNQGGSGHVNRVQNYVLVQLRVRAADVATIAQQAGVLWVEPQVPNRALDEKQNLIVAGRTNGPGHGPIAITNVPPGQSYLDFLTNTVGFSTSSAQYPIVDVADSGVDTIRKVVPPQQPDSRFLVHPAFYEFGETTNQTRVAYNNNFAGGTSHDVESHGTKVASIVLGYDVLTNDFSTCLSRETVGVICTTNFGVICNPVQLICITNVVCVGQVGDLCSTNFQCFAVNQCDPLTDNFLPPFDCLNQTVTISNVFQRLRRDHAGFQLGMGVSPFGRLGISKIFSDGGAFVADPETLVLNSYLSGGRIQNNSWGQVCCISAGEYDSDALIFDILTRDAVLTGQGGSSAPLNQEFIVVFAGGNAQAIGGVGGFGDVLITPPATAKNVISVGASENVRLRDGCLLFTDQSDDSRDIAIFSSFGPTIDGRMKPEIVAPGASIWGGVSTDDPTSSLTCVNPLAPTDPRFNLSLATALYDCANGTSFSAPAVSGAIQLLWWYFQNRLGLPQPSPAMAKAYTVNAARYLTGIGAGDTLPSIAQGMGMLDLERMFDNVPRVVRDQSTPRAIDTFRITTNTIAQQTYFSQQGQTYEISGEIHDSTKPFRVTVAWSDAPGSPQAFKQLVNDLDLQVTIGGNTYKGNVFDGPYSKTIGFADDVNNLESVFLPPGQTGSWTVLVRTISVAGDGVPNVGLALDQDFALVVYNAKTNPVPSDVANNATNDACESAIEITSFPFTHTVNLHTPPYHNTHISPSVSRGGIEAFWKISAPAAGTQFDVDTFGSDFDTVLSVWQGRCGALVELVGNNNESNTFQSALSFIADGSNTYYIVAEGQNNKKGLLQLNVRAAAPPVVATPSSLFFGTQMVGTTGNVVSVIVSNGLPRDLFISELEFSGANPGDFAVFSENCSNTFIGPGGLCEIRLRFVPQGVGDRAANLVVNHDAIGGPLIIPLTGDGLAAVPLVCLSQSAIAFGNVAVGQLGTITTITVTNCGAAPLVISSITKTGANPGDFVESSDCPAKSPLAPNSSCDLNVNFVPTAAGVRSATYNINHNAAGSPTIITVSGNGTAPVAAACVNPTTVDFGSRAVGSLSAPSSITVSNCGTAVLNVGAITITGSASNDYTFVGCSNTSVPVGETCQIQVTFNPTVPGGRLAQLNIPSNSTGSPQIISLNGIGNAGQPDATIKRKGSSASYLGNDIYNVTGSDQTISTRARRGKSRTFFVRIQNDGNQTDQFRVQGPSDIPGVLTVKYLLGNDGSQDITAAVKAGTFTTSSLAAGATTGQATLIRVEIRIDPAAPTSEQLLLFTITSVGDPVRQDAAGAKLLIP